MYTTLLQHQLGTEKAGELIGRHNAIARKNIKENEGSEVEHEGIGFIVSFTSATKAMTCALAIQKDLPPHETELLGIKISINGGEPIENSNKLFGNTIQFANYLCLITDHSHVAVAANVKKLASNELYQKKQRSSSELIPAGGRFSSITVLKIGREMAGSGF